MDDVNLDGAIWVDEFPQGDDGNPQFWRKEEMKGPQKVSTRRK
jgi:hypothetical protein